MKLPYQLGYRRVYLLGVDMRSTGRDYTWGNLPVTPAVRERNRNAMEGNLRSYGALATRMGKLRPVLDAAGYRVQVCTAGSLLLRVGFDHVPLRDAVEAEHRDRPRLLAGYPHCSVARDLPCPSALMRQWADAALADVDRRKRVTDARAMRELMGCRP